MFLNKVEICGVNTSELPLLSDEEKENLFIQIEQGNMDAREQYVKGNLRLVLSVIQRFPAITNMPMIYSKSAVSVL